jgi:hypothetical protein
MLFGNQTIIPESELEETFVNKKFEQLKSTMELLKKHGWEGCTFDDNTVYVPLVVVPNAGIPATVSADIDVKLRAGNLGPNVRSPGILVYHELQVFEGVCEHRKPMAFANMTVRWASTSAPGSARCSTSLGPPPQRCSPTSLKLARFEKHCGLSQRSVFRSCC